MKLPTTRQGCIKLYDLYRRYDLPMTELDMYLGGMICCSNDEFLYRKPDGNEGELIGGRRPCLCKCWESDNCGNCFGAIDATLRMPWDAPLYEGAHHE